MPEAKVSRYKTTRSQRDNLKDSGGDVGGLPVPIRVDDGRDG